MNHERNSIILGICNGSLQESTQRLLNRLGIAYDPNGREIIRSTANTLVSAIFTSRPQHVVTALRNGLVNCALIGSDMLAEHQEHDDEFARLGTVAISRTGIAINSRVIAFVIADSPYRSVRDLEGQSLLSEFPRLTQRWLQQNATNARVIESSGSTESMIATGMYACGIGVTETGASLRANKLRILETLSDAPVAIVVRNEDADREGFRHFAACIMAVHRAEQYWLVKMNVSAENRDRVIGCVPALEAPTVSPQGTGFAVETAILKNELLPLLVQLRSAGAHDIIWHDIYGCAR